MLGVKIRQVREEQNCSLRKLARETGLSHSFISEIENNICNPSIKSLEKIALALNKKPGFFLDSLVANNEQEMEGDETHGFQSANAQ